MNKKNIAVSIDLELPLNRYNQFYQGVKDYAENKPDWFLINDHFPEVRLQKSGYSSCYDGIIGRVKRRAYHVAKKFNIPMVSNWAEGGIEDIPVIHPDFEEAGKLVGEYLLKRGFIKFMSFEMDEAAHVLFRKGLKQVLPKRRVELIEYDVDYDFNVDGEEWYKFRNDFIILVNSLKPPLVICASGSNIALKLLAFCHECELKVPEEVAIITSGNEDSHFKTQSPTISNIEYDFYGSGFKAAKVLDELMNDIVPTELKILTAPGKIFTRDSTDIYASEDNDVQKSLAYIHDHLEQEGLVNTISDTLKMNRRALEYKFKKHLGVSVLDAVSQIRVDLSKKLLAESSESILSIQQKAGFTTPLQMRRIFHKLEGMAPGEYRKKYYEN